MFCWWFSPRCVDSLHWRKVCCMPASQFGWKIVPPLSSVPPKVRIITLKTQLTEMWSDWRNFVVPHRMTAGTMLAAMITCLILLLNNNTKKLYSTIPRWGSSTHFLHKEPIGYISHEIRFFSCPKAKQRLDRLLSIWSDPHEGHYYCWLPASDMCCATRVAHQWPSACNG